jgi:hypothetical protein
VRVCFVLFLFSLVYNECKRSRIVLALLSTGEAYVVDSRKEHRARVELCETLSEDDDDERARYLVWFLLYDCTDVQIQFHHDYRAI